MNSKTVWTFCEGLRLATFSIKRNSGGVNWYHKQKCVQKEINPPVKKIRFTCSKFELERRIWKWRESLKRGKNRSPENVFIFICLIEMGFDLYSYWEYFKMNWKGYLPSKWYRRIVIYSCITKRNNTISIKYNNILHLRRCLKIATSHFARLSQ